MTTLRGPRKDFTGQVIGRLTVLSLSDRPPVRHRYFYNCQCECGTALVVSSRHFPHHPLSCGCLFREVVGERNSTHGASRLHQEHSDGYDIWVGMIRRCHDAKFRNYKNYGAKGTRVCDRWRFGDAGVHGFVCFMADMGPRPTKKHTIDRIQNHLPYEPTNCRWATMQEQQRNRTNNRIVHFAGRDMSLAEAVELAGQKYGTVHARLRSGWTVERALGGGK